jgi:hypothetical protein
MRAPTLDRRSFIVARTPGSSWAATKPISSGCGGRSEGGGARGPIRQPDCPTWQRSGGSCTPSINGWRQRWTAWLTPGARFSRPNSCCPGRSRRRVRPKSIWRSCNTICGSPIPRRRCCRSSRGREVGRNHHPQHLLLTAEKKSWRCVVSGEEPRLFGVEPPKPRLEAVRIVDMSASNSWAEFAANYRRTRPAYQEHETAKADLKKLVPADAKEAVGHGLRAKRSQSGAISFELPGGRRCTVPVTPSAPLLQPWPRPKANLVIQKRH